MNYFNLDLDYIQKETAECDFRNGNILITGCAGFLGYYLFNYFASFKDQLGIKSIIGLDSFLLGCPEWLQKIKEKNDSGIELIKFNIGKDRINDLTQAKDITHIIHMASIASPTFYRKYPLETVDANIWGLRDLLDYYCKSKKLRGFLFFSSSEIYGDPDPINIPTKEDYKGYVSCTGPRACYDEAKRFGETLCSIFREKYNQPITIVRPFNNYGPGMKVNDKRLPADIAKFVIENRPILLYSDGKPTRTFCYIADAVCGYLKALNSGNKTEYNIGIDLEETSVYEFARYNLQIGRELFNYSGNIQFAKSFDNKYLADNPQRRCPNIEKARNELNYNPKISLRDGITRYLSYLFDQK